MNNYIGWPGTYLLRYLLSGLLFFMHSAHAQLDVDIAYIKLQQEHRPVLSNILPEPKDAGLRGAELALQDSNTTGRFLKQTFHLRTDISDNPEETLTQIQFRYEQGIRLFVFDLPADTLKTASTWLAKASLNTGTTDDVLIFNTQAKENALRVNQCIDNVLHTIPSRAMLADALAQWLTEKRLNKWLLIKGSTEADHAYAQSMQRAAKRFGNKIVAQKQWSFDTDLRRLAQKEMPLFTQTEEYDVVVVADELGDFGEYVLYNTWYPRPVVGTQGLTPVAWHRVVEQWGAAQLQSRFEKLTGRWMDSKDYASWLAVRSIAEAVTRTNTADTNTLKQYIISDKFELAGFKGRKLNFRTWNGQLRQPIPLVHPRSLVSQSPQAGFLHPSSELDTLGFDAPESQCRLAKRF
ncbi:ABC transporter substrate-binding protein [Neptunomonas japonica]|uniref:ABC transporter substrate-binding protein n=1 Tax=Neptunomonas japonica TaxID=417574 RepID=UPI000429C9BC|nr:ABC transporter substrate-binding protein [Neptunomonas japonica]